MRTTRAWSPASRRNTGQSRKSGSGNIRSETSVGVTYRYGRRNSGGGGLAPTPRRRYLTARCPPPVAANEC
jgi:hypothetical protein